MTAIYNLILTLHWRATTGVQPVINMPSIKGRRSNQHVGHIKASPSARLTISIYLRFKNLDLMLWLRKEYTRNNWGVSTWWVKSIFQFISQTFYWSPIDSSIRKLYHLLKKVLCLNKPVPATVTRWLQCENEAFILEIFQKLQFSRNWRLHTSGLTTSTIPPLLEHVGIKN